MTAKLCQSWCGVLQSLFTILGRVKCSVKAAKGTREIDTFGPTTK